MKCELCEREDTEDNKLDLRRPGKLQHAETTTVVVDREKGNYCKLCRKEQEIYSRKEIFQALKETNLVDGMNNIRTSKLPEKPIQDIVAEIEEYSICISARKNELEEETMLSEREAELYVLTEELGYNTVEASEKMGISKNNAYGKRGDIKEKIEKAEKTAKLEM